MSAIEDLANTIGRIVRPAPTQRNLTAVPQQSAWWGVRFNPLKEKLGNYFGKSFKHLLIDSYEADFQDWTPAFRKDFIKLKGYDPLPYLISFDVNSDKKHFIVENKDFQHTLINMSIKLKFGK